MLEEFHQRLHPSTQTLTHHLHLSLVLAGGVSTHIVVRTRLTTSTTATALFVI